MGDPWVAQWFSACLWLRARSWRPGTESHVGLPVHGACFSLCLCLCLSLALFVTIINKCKLKKKKEWVMEDCSLDIWMGYYHCRAILSMLYLKASSESFCFWLKITAPRDTWLAKSLEHVTLNLRVMPLSPTLGVQPIKKNHSS